MTDAADRLAAAELAGEMRWFAAASAGVPAALRRRLLELAAVLERLAEQKQERVATGWLPLQHQSSA